MESEKKARKQLLVEKELKQLIAERAYEIYLNRGSREGDPFSDWIQAEKEILLRFPAGARSRKAANAILKSGGTPRKKTAEPAPATDDAARKIQVRKTVSPSILLTKPAVSPEKPARKEGKESPKPLEH